MAQKDRGFASMPAHKRQEISSKGGKASHAKGVAHEWTSEEARAAGHKGGKVAHQRKRDAAALARST
jgi:general stress protein YciG